MSDRFDVTIVGSGFAGSILARVLAGRGLRVALLERGQHPRFALGESSTPLAAIALERLADRFDLPDLRALAAHGRWRRELPALTCGLKRGFTFYGHPPDRGLDPAERMMVAASPNDEVADVHWLRADVDAHLAHAAAAEGVDLRTGVEARSAEETGRGLRLRGPKLDLETTFLVDATGPGAFATRALGVPPSSRGERLSTALVYGHFAEVAPLDELAPAGPYPHEQAAVHHLLPEGWLYSLRFDNGLTSAGFELVTSPADSFAGPGESALRRLLSRYPSLARAFARARAVRPVAIVPRLQFRRARAAGPRFLLLPSAFAFTSPLFSTGIAWSLRGVERAVRLLEHGPPCERALGGYHSRLEREAEWIERLIEGALAARARFELFASWSLLYFAAASFGEARERLLPEPAEGWAAEGFLGADHPHLAAIVGAAETALDEALAGRLAAEEFDRQLRELIRPLDVAGLCQPRPDRLFPMDLEALVAAAERLGTTADSVRAALPRLRGVK